MRKMNNGKIGFCFVLAAFALLSLAACGGGGGGGGTAPPAESTDTDSSTDTNNTSPGISGFDFTLAEGDYWEYAWVYKQSNTSSSGTSGESDIGNFRITLGAPQAIDGKTAFPVTISGKRTDPANFTYAKNLTHIALDGNQIFASTDGSTLKVIFDAGTAKGTGGFFAPLGVLTATDISSVTMDNQFVKDTSAYRLGGSTDDPLCETILGSTVCGDDAYSIREYEYYKPGIGPISYYYLMTNTYTGGGYTTYHRTERTLGIIDSSLSAPDGYSPADYPWRIKAEIPIVNFDAWSSAGAVLNGKIHVVYKSELHIYDPATDSWARGPNTPEPVSSGVGLAYANQMYVFQGTSIYIYDPGSNTWAKSADPFAFSRFLQQYRVAMLQNNNADRYGVFVDDTSNVAFHFYDFQNVQDVDWLPSGYPNGFYKAPSIAIYNNQIYVFGGSYGYQDTWAYVTNYTNQTYKIDPYLELVTWTSLTAMPTARSGAMAVVYGDKIYLFGGNGKTDDASYAVEEYDTAADTWQVKRPSPLSLGYGLAFNVNDKIYLVDKGYVLEYSMTADQ